MSSPVPFIFDHSHHKLQVLKVSDPLDVLVFEGEEQLSQPFTYRITFTCPSQDLDVKVLLGNYASFSLYPENAWRRKVCPGLEPEPVKPLRRLHGIITGFERLGASADEARYQVTLQPRLALLGRGRQCRLYQHKSVPEIVEQVLRQRHGFQGQDFLFTLARQYPRREQVMQYEESDLAFIARLLAEVGIAYRFGSDERLGIDVVEFFDDARHYPFGLELPVRPPSGLAVDERDSVYALRTHHRVVEQHTHVRSYHHRHADTLPGGDVNQAGPVEHPAWTHFTYGEAYHYAEPFTRMDDALARDESLLTESGYFFARLRHERYLNDQTRLTGHSDSARLATGHVLKVLEGGARSLRPWCGADPAVDPGQS